MLATLLLSLFLADEAALREAFARDIKAEEAPKRIAALKSLAGAKESKTVELLTPSLKDAAKDVRIAAAESIEASSDPRGTAIKPLGELLSDKTADVEVRLACAKALAKASYKEEPFKFFLATMSGIASEDRHLHKFGYEVTKVLDGFLGRSFGVDKQTCERWGEWWTDNAEAVKQADAKTRAENAGKD